MFFNEDLVLDIRLNTLNKFVDHFVIKDILYKKQIIKVFK